MLLYIRMYVYVILFCTLYRDSSCRSHWKTILQKESPFTTLESQVCWDLNDGCKLNADHITFSFPCIPLPGQSRAECAIGASGRGWEVALLMAWHAIVENCFTFGCIYSFIHSKNWKIYFLVPFDYDFFYFCQLFFYFPQLMCSDWAGSVCQFVKVPDGAQRLPPSQGR